MTTATTTARVELRISAGPGPVGARRFVAALVTAIGHRLAEAGLVTEFVQLDGDRRAPRAAILAVTGAVSAVDAAAQALVGTHRTIEAVGKRGTRRRWFAAITVVPVTASPATARPDDLEIRCVRARGPGGQNVNRRATAVQVRHAPTGAVVRCDEHRTQARNRAAALRRVHALATRAARSDVDRRRAASWSDQRHLTARECVMHWRTDRGGALVPAAGDELSGSGRTPRRRSA
ncbi:MAG: hypothetical protein JNK45_01885 [Myxococcales bacterium]|nr:hypothetical protein [Myxococcales bacterium]